MPLLAFCPCAPALVPEVAQGAAGETASVLAACDAAVQELRAVGDRVLVVGAGALDRGHDGAASGSLAGFGVPARAGGSGPSELPLALTVGAWLLDRAGWPTAGRSYRQVASPGTSAELDGWAAADAWLVMGDGTARLSERAPGGLDPAAADYDATVLDALASGDPAALAGLDAATGVRMMAAGAPVWRAVGVALSGAAPDRRRWSARVLSHEAPYGVSYVVATWT